MRMVLDRPARRLLRAGEIPAPSDLPINGMELPNTNGILVAFRITGGIGDHLIAARFVRDLIAVAGEFRFDIYSSRPEVAAWVFGSMPQFNQAYDEYFCWHGRHYYRHYPLALWVQQFVVVMHDTVQWPLLNRRHPKLVRICEASDRFRHARDLGEILHAHPRLDGLLGSKARFMDRSRHDFSQGMCGIAYGGPRVELPSDASALAKFGLSGRYCTIHNGFDAEFQTAYGFATKSTKVYPHFAAVLALLRQHAPDLVVVQVGSSTSTPLPGVDVPLIGRTNLAEVAALLGGAALHIDNESGLVHLAACLGTTACVLFGPTPVDYFGYAANLNIAPRICGGCWWTTKDWMTICPRGFAGPECLSQTPPEAVAAAIISYLESRPAEPIRQSG
jgi:hypothetical protein